MFCANVFSLIVFNIRIDTFELVTFITLCYLLQTCKSVLPTKSCVCKMDYSIHSSCTSYRNGRNVKNSKHDVSQSLCLYVKKCDKLA